VIVNILRGKPLPVYGDGLNIRDWLHVTITAAPWMHSPSRRCRRGLQRGRPKRVHQPGSRAPAVRNRDEQLREHPALQKQYPACPVAQGKSAATLITFVTDRPDTTGAMPSMARRSRRRWVSNLAHSARGLEDTFEWYVNNPTWWETILEVGIANRLRSRNSRESAERLT